MNNIKKIIKTVIIFIVIIAFPMAMRAEAPCQKTDSTAVNCRQHCSATANQQCAKQCNNASTHSISGDEIMQSSTADTKINLNFNLNHNKETFVKALDILLIGFSIVFVVMIIFIYVSKGIDKLFPYKEEDLE